MPEQAELFVKWDGEVFRPKDRFDVALAAKFRQDVPLRAKISERRTLPRQRLYWAVLQAVVDATGKWPNAEALHWSLKVFTGFIEEIASLNGEVLIRPKSTSFAKMSEQDFREYMDHAMLALTTEVTPGLSVEDLLLLGQARIAETNPRSLGSHEEQR